jgi:hypothetical protein
MNKNGTRNENSGCFAVSRKTGIGMNGGSFGLAIMGPYIRQRQNQKKKCRHLVENIQKNRESTGEIRCKSRGIVLQYNV